MIGDKRITGLVVNASDYEIRIRHASASVRDQLHALGFVREGPGKFVLETGEKLDLGVVFSSLRDIGIGFSAGGPWYPAELVKEVRGEGKFAGVFISARHLCPEKLDLRWE